MLDFLNIYAKTDGRESRLGRCNDVLECLGSRNGARQFVIHAKDEMATTFRWQGPRNIRAPCPLDTDSLHS
jgi:hypothetical protein